MPSLYLTSDWLMPIPEHIGLNHISTPSLALRNQIRPHLPPCQEILIVAKKMSTLFSQTDQDDDSNLQGKYFTMQNYSYDYCTPMVRK